MVSQIQIRDCATGNDSKAEIVVISLWITLCRLYLQNFLPPHKLSLVTISKWNASYDSSQTFQKSIFREIKLFFIGFLALRFWLTEPETHPKVWNTAFLTPKVMENRRKKRYVKRLIPPRDSRSWIWIVLEKACYRISRWFVYKLLMKKQMTKIPGSCDNPYFFEKTNRIDCEQFWSRLVFKLAN